MTPHLISEFKSSSTLRDELDGSRECLLRLRLQISESGELEGNCRVADAMVREKL